MKRFLLSGKTKKKKKKKLKNLIYIKKKKKKKKKKKLLLQDFTSAFDIHPCSKYVKPVLLI